LSLRHALDVTGARGRGSKFWAWADPRPHTLSNVACAKGAASPRDHQPILTSNSGCPPTCRETLYFFRPCSKVTKPLLFDANIRESPRAPVGARFLYRLPSSTDAESCEHPLLLRLKDLLGDTIAVLLALLRDTPATLLALGHLLQHTNLLTQPLVRISNMPRPPRSARHRSSTDHLDLRATGLQPTPHASTSAPFMPLHDRALHTHGHFPVAAIPKGPNL